MDRHSNTFSQIADSIKGEAALRTQELSEAEKRVLNMSEPSQEEHRNGSVNEIPVKTEKIIKDEITVEAKETVREEVNAEAKETAEEEATANIKESEKVELVEKTKIQFHDNKDIADEEAYQHKTMLVSKLDNARALADDEADYIPEIPAGGRLVGSIVDESVMETEPVVSKKGRLKLPKLSFLIIIPVFLIVLAYIGGVIYFGNHYEPRTLIGTLDCSMMNRQESAVLLENSMSTFEIFMVGREGFNATIQAQDIAAQVVYDRASLDESLSLQTALAWPLHCIMGRNVAIATQVNYDSEKLTEAIAKAPIMDSRIARKPENAKLGYSEAEQSMVVIPEDPGCEPDKEAIFNVISQAMTSMEAGQKQILINLDESDCYVRPEIISTDENLNRVAREADAMARTRVVYDWNGNEVIVDGTLIADWIKCEGSRVLLDEDKVAQFVETNAAAYDTYNQPFMFRTSTGKRVSIDRHEYGWRTDIEAETAALIEHINSCDHIDKEPAYAFKGYVKGLDDIGSSYVEIDLGSQHLYLYEDGVRTLETDFVSGGPPNGDYTPDGIYGITYKTTNAVLRGPGYETPVTYWMPFNGGIGLHDAYWRSEFGGDIYKRSGSHGCVNLPPTAAKTIYGVVCTNFPIVCYW